jgi:hypothetical protein
MRSVALPVFSVLGLLALAGCGASSNTARDIGDKRPAGGDADAMVPPDPGTPGKLPEVPCNLHTAYPGDENCIAPPEPGVGYQLHIGPSSYDDPDVINAKDANGNYLWLMVPGDERTECFHAVMPNEESFYYFQTQYRMRTGSHHMILRGSDSTDTVEGWGKCQSSIVAAIGGTQHVKEDFPPNGIMAPEDEGLAHQFTPHQVLDAQLHFYNATEETRLREVWVNYIAKPADEVKMNLGMLGAFTSMNVAPHTTAVISGACKSEQAIGAGDLPRVVSLFGHAHSHNKRFVVNYDKADGTSEVIYDSYDGAEAPTYVYNSLVQIPVADPVARRSGGRSGLLTLAPGEQLSFHCDVVNDTDVTFHGTNEVFNDEMCHLFGAVAGLGFPCFNLNRGM